jgi:predicted DNA-binding transcriptional regulator YafY
VRKAVEEGLAAARTVCLRYCGKDGAESERRVDPQLLGHAFGRWHLVGCCHMRKAIRWFRLDRITAARLTGQASTDRPVAEGTTLLSAPESSGRLLGLGA